MIKTRILTIIIFYSFLNNHIFPQPKYIHNLLKAVEIRKKEQEKRMEKKIQREREMEKGEFDDKEAFVTSAYKKKLQERAEEEEREKRAAALEGEMEEGEGRRKQKRQNSALWLAVCSVTELLDYNVIVIIYVYE